MKKIYVLFLPFIILAMAVTAFASTSNPSPASPGYTPMVITIMGQYTSTTAGVVKFKAPNGYRVVAANATARASSGTTPTLTVDIKTGTTSILNTPVAITAGTVADAVLSTSPKLVDEGNVSIDLTIGGGTPVWQDITVFMLLKRL